MLTLLLTTFAFVASAEELDPISDQIVIFKEKTQGPIGILTTSAGAPIESRETESTLNTNLLENEYFVDTLTHFVRERIPVRVVHSKGAGAFGYFITTQDISDKCKAEFLDGVGKVTPVAVRLSMEIVERGGSDLSREPRGFAVKFYTKEGNFDIAGFNTPVFVFKEPSLLVSFAHALRKNPATDFTDVNMIWDFLTLRPETLFMFLIVFSDLGIPDGYRNMPGFSIHTYPIYNANGTLSYTRFYFQPVGGVKNLNSTEAARLGANDPDYSARQLYSAIASGDYPTWDVSVQILSQKDVDDANFDVFDVSKLIPEAKYPLHPIGKLVLNKMPRNYFAEVEQMAFCPGNLVPGILGSPDKTFEARRFSYRDAQRYRLRANFDKILVNCPYRSKVFTYNRDGRAPVFDNGLEAPIYYPNSFNGPVAYKDKHRPRVPKIHEKEAYNYDQARDYYEFHITGDERSRLVENIVSSLCGATNFLQDRAVKAFRKIHSDLANRITKALAKNSCRH